MAIKALVQVLTIMTTVTSLGAFVRLYRRLREQIRSAGLLPKLVALKLLVLVIAHEKFAFLIVQIAGAFVPTETMSNGDFTVGILGVVVSGEMLLYSIGYWWVFGAGEFKRKGYGRIAGGDGGGGDAADGFEEGGRGGGGGAADSSQGLVEMGPWTEEGRAAESGAHDGNCGVKVYTVERTSVLHAYAAVFDWSDLFRGMGWCFREFGEFVSGKKVYEVRATARSY